MITPEPMSEARLAEIRARDEKCNLDCNEGDAVWKRVARDRCDLLREVYRLKERLAECERDARRYRWLKTRINWCDYVRHHGELSIAQREWTHIDYRRNPPQSEHIDEYIDAALTADGEGRR